jgi:hypothetical protein
MIRNDNGYDLNEEDLSFGLGIDDEDVNNRENELQTMFRDEEAALEDDEDEGEEDDPVPDDSQAGNTKKFLPAIRNNELPTIPRIYGMERDCCGIQESTEIRFRTITKYWIGFASKEDENETPFLENFGLGLYDSSHYSAERDNADSSFNINHVRQFFLYLQEAGVSFNQMNKAKQFINSHLRCEFKNRLIAANHPSPHFGSASIGNSVEVTGIIQGVRKRKAKKDMDECFDIHAEVDNVIEKIQDREMLELAVDIIDDSESHVRKLNGLSKLEFLASYNSSKQNLRRGEEHYNQRLVQRFVRRIEGIGPAPGMQCVHVVTNESKRNKTGHLQYTAFARHNDPQQDTAASHGLLLLFRFCVCYQHIEDFF